MNQQLHRAAAAATSANALGLQQRCVRAPLPPPPSPPPLLLQRCRPCMAFCLLQQQWQRRQSVCIVHSLPQDSAGRPDEQGGEAADAAAAAGAPATFDEAAAAPPADAQAEASASAYEAAAAAPDAPVASSSSTGGGGAPSTAGAGGFRGFGTVALPRRLTGPGYTFLLAGFLKILTLGGLAASAPQDVARTAAGKASGYFLVPVGLAMAWLAKQITDAGLHESRRFLAWMTAALVLIYFALVKVLYRADPALVYELSARRPRARMPGGPMAEIRRGAGDRELLASGGATAGAARAYRPRAGGGPGGKDDGLMDDLAYYEGRYPDVGAPPAAAKRRGGGVNARSLLPSAPDEL